VAEPDLCSPHRPMVNVPEFRSCGPMGLIFFDLKGDLCSFPLSDPSPRAVTAFW